MLSSLCISLQVTSCMTVFNAVVGWIMGDAGSRKQYFASLMGRPICSFSFPCRTLCCSNAALLFRQPVSSVPALGHLPLLCSAMQASCLRSALYIYMVSPSGIACPHPLFYVQVFLACTAHHAAHSQLIHYAVLLQQPSRNLA